MPWALFPIPVARVNIAIPESAGIARMRRIQTRSEPLNALAA